jgi:hypothetical protein
MDPWKELAAREECRDAVRAWAELEGQSPPMVEDFVRSFRAPSIKNICWRLALGLGVKFAAWAYETWWHVTRR